jgi:hypothetical protein
MNGFTTAIILAALLCAAAQDSSMESKAVTRVQQTAASQYDPSLPSRPFGNWFNQVVGPQSGVSWHLGECSDFYFQPSSMKLANLTLYNLFPSALAIVISAIAQRRR